MSNHPTTFLNLPAMVWLRAQRQPDRWAVHAEGASWCWNELATRIESAALALQRLDVQTGDRLTIVSETSADALVLMLAAQRIGAWPALLNARVPAAELRRLASCVDSRRIILALDGSPDAKTHARQLAATPLAVPGLGHLASVTFSDGAVPELPAHDPALDVALLAFTSGTSGKPKAVMISHAGLMNMGRVVGAARGTLPRDTVEVTAPLSHAMGLSSVVSALIFGAAVRLRPRMSPRELAKAIAAGEVQQASMVPAAWARLLDHIAREELSLDGHSLRMLVSGGAPLAPELKARVERAFGRPLINAYGMTECAPLARSRPSEFLAPWSVGRPEATVEVRIVDGAGRDLPRGETGEILARGPGVMLGYYRNAEATREVLSATGWFSTGDLGHWLPDGDFAVVGRRKEMIIRSGFNVYPAEVEAAISGHPAVIHAAVVGRPAALGDESIVAYVQPRRGHPATDALRDTLAAHVRARLAGYKCPSRWIFVEAMPMGDTGKILKRALPEPDVSAAEATAAVS
ncbi:class I adenylate-forming enzyme family protein [Ideonella sp. B508-1]|uniref:class I adenylate-forming enzyme family protein n=1 Tax=Ideonella sp. B508-1 TaxID=137716 RepID=UPI00034A5CAB|nr:class I adenylate-forming enzyme family protein [Ideonella sp. B508-1]